MSVYVIAEIGSCHDGSFAKASQLIAAAKACGADAVKGQFWSNPDRLAARRKVPDVYRDVYRKYRIPEAWLGDLWREAYDLKLDFLCTAYLPEDVPVVEPHVAAFKVASFEADALDLGEAYRQVVMADRAKGRTRNLLVSAGLGGTAACLNVLPYGYVRESVWTLLCVSAYPAPVEDLDLGRLRLTSQSGFSDHTDPALTWTGALAVAAGAKVIEAHLRLETTDAANPDAPHAMRPEQFVDYVRHVRFAEQCAGTRATGEVRPSEAPMAGYKVTGA